MIITARTIVPASMDSANLSVDCLMRVESMLYANPGTIMPFAPVHPVSKEILVQSAKNCENPEVAFTTATAL